MTPLETQMMAQIRAQGPISVAEYMTACLLHPEHGYYSTGQPLGAAGDFITAPEISQMFGELVGLALAQSWLDQGSPARITLAELGPGRGTLMADILRSAGKVPGFATACDVHLVEASASLRDVQARTLDHAAPQWHETVQGLPQDAPLFVVANEFFDALPIRQYVRTGAAWSERHVGLRDGALHFGLAASAPVTALTHRLEDTAEGDLVEICPMAGPIMTQLGAQIEAQGGAALIFDYGDWRSLGDTLQAIRGHAATGVLSAPGQCDLTAHVDFEALVQDLPCAHSRLTVQGVWLERLGITARAQSLAAQLTGEPLRQHIAAHRRLTHPDEMGTVFKTLALFPSGSTLPPGFAP